MSAAKCELFLLRDDAGPILYAPLRHLSAALNEAAVGAVARRLYGKPPADGDAAVLKPLEDCGFFLEAEVPRNETDRTIQVTLFPTDGCNLRCRYCYAGAGNRRHVMPLEAGKAAIDRVADRAKELGEEHFVVGFHGNGEPFFAFDRIRELCRYTREAEARTGVKGSLTLATNGVLNDEQLDWLIAWFDSVNISFDGLEELQNRQRPMADGSGSFPLVHRTLKRLNDEGKAFGIRTTVTAAGVDRMPEIAAFVLENYPRCDPLHLEPSWEAGRSLETGERSPDPDVFIRRFLEADAVLDGRIPLVYSGILTDYLGCTFCSVSGDSFVVTPEGLVTACFEVAERSDPRSERYIYGAFDPGLKRFVFDEARRSDLHTLTVDRMPYCRDCFCKYHCCGDCAAKVLGLKPPEAHEGSSRCRITRALTLHRIRNSLNEGGNEHA